MEEDLPFQSTKQTPVQNSESAYQCWFIENPSNRSLQKKLVVEIEGEQECEVLVVLQTPMGLTKSNLISQITLSHVPDHKDGAKYTQKRIGVNSEVLSERKSGVTSTQVLICGKLHNPAVTCTKALKSSASSAVIPLCVRKDVEVQKFKLPFKCVSSESTETDFEFIFIKSVKPVEVDLNDFMSTEMRNFRVFECMTFFCLPAVLPVGHAN